MSSLSVVAFAITDSLFGIREVSSSRKFISAFIILIIGVMMYLTDGFHSPPIRVQNEFLIEGTQQEDFKEVKAQ